MNEKPTMKLFNWKNAVMVTLAGIGGVSHRAYESYQQKGHLDSVDFRVVGITIAIMFSIVAILGWWANREE